MTTYELRTIDDREQLFKIDDDGKEWAVPQDPANSDYQRYLNPEAEQSTPIVLENNG
jgi:hypothetical protein